MDVEVAQLVVLCCQRHLLHLVACEIHEVNLDEDDVG